MPYLVDVGGVLDALGSEIDVSDSLGIAPVDLGDVHFEPIGPAAMDVRLGNTGAGIVASGSVTACMRTICVRCLREFDTTLRAGIDGFYVRPGDEEGVPEEQETLPIADGRIDLEPAALQALLVDLPFAPVCGEGCKGLCASCGADLNEGTCDCAPIDTKHPFAQLGRLLVTGGEDDAGPGSPE